MLTLYILFLKPSVADLFRGTPSPVEISPLSFDIKFSFLALSKLIKGKI